MSIPPESVAVGRCYLAKGGSIRRVTSTGSDGTIRFRQRVGAGPWSSGSKNRKRKNFALQVEREVPCDWMPESGKKP